MKKYFLFIVMVSWIFSAQTFADDCLEKDLLTQLYTLEDSSIICMKEDKCYLNAEKIFVIQDGIYLESDYFGSLALSNLMRDEEGVYTVGLYAYWKCNGCSTCYRSRPAKCRVCGGTSFRRMESLPPD